MRKIYFFPSLPCVHYGEWSLSVLLWHRVVVYWGEAMNVCSRYSKNLTLFENGLGLNLANTVLLGQSVSEYDISITFLCCFYIF